MSDAETVALISTAGLVLVALIGVLVELVRTRRRADTSVAQLQPNHGTSLRDAVDRIEANLEEVRTEQRTGLAEVRTEQRTQGDRLIVVETRLTDHLAQREPPPPRG